MDVLALIFTVILAICVLLLTAYARRLGRRTARTNHNVEYLDKRLDRFNYRIHSVDRRFTTFQRRIHEATDLEATLNDA